MRLSKSEIEQRRIAAIAYARDAQIILLAAVEARPNELATIPLRRSKSKSVGRFDGFVAVVDRAYLDELSQYEWQAELWGYRVWAMRDDGGKSISLAQDVMGLVGARKPEPVNDYCGVDHADGNDLNCTAANLVAWKKSPLELLYAKK